MHTKKHSEFYGWKLVAVFFLIYFINGAFPYYGGTVINTYMAQEMLFDRSTLGLGFSVFVLSLGLASPVLGLMVNRVGVSHTLTAGSLLLCVAAALMALAVSLPWHYIVIFGVLMGVGVGMGAIIPVSTGVTLWFRRRKALAMSLVLCASGCGALVAAPTLHTLISSLDGDWRSGWILVAIACCIAAIASFFLVHNKPEDLGQYVDGVSPADISAAEQGVSRADIVHQTDHQWTVREAFATRSLWLIILASIAFTLPFNMSVAHGVIHLRDVGIPDGTASLSIGLVVMFSIVGRIASGLLGDKVELRYIWFISLLATACGSTTLFYATSNWHVYIYAATTGIGFGAAFVCLTSILGNYFGTDSFAPIFGLLSTVTNIFGATSPLLAGLVYDSTGSYSLAFIGSIGLALSGALIILGAAPPIHGTEREQTKTVSRQK
jgi:MFS family permease